jgi:hypothetical protein
MSARNSTATLLENRRTNLTLSTPVIVTKDIDLRPYALVKKGEKGIVSRIDPDCIFIRMDTIHPHLTAYNEIWVLEDCDDVLECIEIVPDVSPHTGGR